MPLKWDRVVYLVRYWQVVLKHASDSLALAMIRMKPMKLAMAV
jgi:hypothetical protein